jgi:hypothetical protein
LVARTYTSEGAFDWVIHVEFEGNTKVGREQEALRDFISAVLMTSFGGLSLGFRQAW